MVWFKVDDQLHSHPKTRRAGLDAMGLWVVCGSYSMAYKTDGFVPGWLVSGWKNGPKLAQKLVSSGYWTRAIRDSESGWQFHDWADYQPLSAEIEAEREAARIRQSERRKRLRERSPSGTSDADVTANVTAGVTRDEACDVQSESQDPVPSRPVPSVSSVAAQKRGQRLPKGWTPDPAVREAMREECPSVDLDAEHRKFTDHWNAKTGKDAAKLDWNATWRNWIRNARPVLNGQRRYAANDIDDWMNR
jgi:hypothetical protein